MLHAGLAVTTLVMLVVTGVGYRALRHARQSSLSVAHTQQVLQALEDVLGHVFDAEAATRAYEATGDPSHLESIARAERLLPTTLDAVAALTDDNGIQQRLIPELRRQVGDTMGALHHIIEDRRAGIPVTRIESDRQKAGADRLRETLRGMRLEEEELLEHRVGADEQAIRTTQAAVLLIVVASSVLLACVFVLLVRDAAKRQRLAAALQRANEDLEGRVEARTAELRQALDGAIEARHEAQEVSRLKDEFLMTVSHELRSRDGALRLGADARDGRDSRRPAAPGDRSHRAQRGRSDAARERSARRLACRVGKIAADVRSVDLAFVVAAAIDSIQPAADAKGIRVQAVVDPNAGPMRGPARLQQVAWNLLSNAVKFTPKGGRVQVRLERVNSHAELIVGNSGAGIAPEFLPFVFDRFRQGRPERPGNTPGSGSASPSSGISSSCTAAAFVPRAADLARARPSGSSCRSPLPVTTRPTPAESIRRPQTGRRARPHGDWTLFASSWWTINSRLATCSLRFSSMPVRR